MYNADIEPKTNMTVSPHLGSSSPSHMKLSTMVQTAEIRRETGMKTEVTIMTGLTNTYKRKLWAKATSALKKVSLVSRGVVCKKVV